MDYDQLFPGRFMKAGEFQGRAVTLTIASVEIEELPQDQGKAKVKGIISFRETKKGLVLNRTNGECFKALFGRETDGWIGKAVTLFTSEWNGEPAIRVKGAPHLKQPLAFELKLPKRRPTPMTLIPTGKGAANGKAQQAEADSLPEPGSEG